MAIRVLMVVCIHLVLASLCTAVEFFHYSRYGELIEEAPITTEVWSDDRSARFPCAPTISDVREGNRINLTAWRPPSGDSGDANVCHSVTFALGRLTAGVYELTVRIASHEGEILESKSRTMAILPLEGRCNRDPSQTFVIAGEPSDGTVEQYVGKVVSDPAFASQVGNPQVRYFNGGFGSLVEFNYPPLQDIPPMMRRIEAASSWLSGMVFRSGFHRGYCEKPLPADVTATFVEYFHAGLDRYFHTGSSAEIAAIDDGKVGSGWARTGESFDAVTAPRCPFADDQTVVYRFLGLPGVGPNAHFFTRSPQECHVVDQSAQWMLEGLPFWASAVAADGSCGVSSPDGRQRVALHRAWRPYGESRHRFSTQRATIDEMVGKGWVDEGAVMCVLAPASSVAITRPAASGAFR